MNKYWQNREIKERERLLDAYITTTENMLKARYLSTANRIVSEMTALYDKIQVENPKPLVSHLYQYNRYWELLAQINTELTELGEKEVKILDTKLLNLYESNYKLIGKQYGLTGHLDTAKAQRTVNTVWTADGMNYSDRIWKHKDQLVQYLQQGLVDCVQAGMSSEQLAKILMDKFGVSYDNAIRLARTELSHVYNQSAVDRYRDSNIAEYEWLTAPGCCKNCQDLNGRRFSTDAQGELPPWHP